MNIITEIEAHKLAYLKYRGSSFDKDGKVFKIHKEIHKDEEKKWLNEAKKSNDERAKEQDWLSIHVENFMLNYKNTAWLTESSDQGV